ncbi:MAG: hypothetical protein KBD66_01870 [Candidatus Doudnabacteria bacterium]|nr:hypothetical protein [Candidatus Doudnabacteria bacterium]
MKNVFRLIYMVVVLASVSSVSIAQERQEYYRVTAIGGPLVSVQADKRVSVNQLYNVRDVHGCILEPEDADNYPYAEFLIPVRTKISGSQTRRWLAAANVEWQRKRAVLRRVQPVSTPQQVPSPSPSLSAVPQTGGTAVPDATPYLPATGRVVTTPRATNVYFALHPPMHMQVGERRNVYYVVGYGSIIRTEPISITVQTLVAAQPSPTTAAQVSSTRVVPGNTTSRDAPLVTAGIVEPGVMWIEAMHPGSAEVRIETQDRAVLASIPLVIQGPDSTPLSGLFNTILLWIVGGACLGMLVWAFRRYWIRYRHQP